MRGFLRCGVRTAALVWRGLGRTDINVGALLGLLGCLRSFLRSDVLLTIVGVGLHSRRRISLGARCGRAAGGGIYRPGMTLRLRLSGSRFGRITGR